MDALAFSLCALGIACAALALAMQSHAAVRRQIALMAAARDGVAMQVLSQVLSLLHRVEWPAEVPCPLCDVPMPATHTNGCPIGLALLGPPGAARAPTREV